jgi:drug/metabolite transporter (DMT)-like permease
MSAVQRHGLGLAARKTAPGEPIRSPFCRLPDRRRSPVFVRRLDCIPINGTPCPDATAVATMLVLMLCWGFQQVAIKVAAQSMPLLAQASVRSIVATLLVVAWARAKSIPLVARDGTLAPGIVAGVAFAVEFALIYAGLGHTTAARIIVFVYLARCATALGLAWLVPGERLAPVQWLGVWTAFAAGAALVLVGIALVNLRPAPRAAS